MARSNMALSPSELLEESYEFDCSSEALDSSSASLLPDKEEAEEEEEEQDGELFTLEEGRHCLSLVSVVTVI